MQYVDTNTLEVLETIGHVRKQVAPNSLPKILTRDSINEHSIDFLYDIEPQSKTLYNAVKGDPIFNKEVNRWEFEYNFEPKYADQTKIDEAIGQALTEAKGDKLKQLSKDLQEEIQSLTENAPIEEIVSFDKQETEARAFINDNTAVTPYLDALLVSRNLGETKEELAQKIIAAADAYTTAHASLLGQFQNTVKNMQAMSANETDIDGVLAQIASITLK